MSSIPTMKANLVTQLQARGGLAGVQITNGPPLPSPQREYIWVGTARGTSEWGSYVAGGAGLRRETYATEVIVNVTREGTDTVAADTRCFALYAEIEAQVDTDPTINGAVMAARVGDFELKEMVTPGGEARQSELVVNIECDTFI